MNAANSALAASAFFAGTPPPTTEPDVPPEPTGNVLCQCQMHPHPNIKLCDPPPPSHTSTPRGRMIGGHVMHVGCIPPVHHR